MKSIPVWPATIAVFFVSSSIACAETQIPSRLECSAFSNSPVPRGPFTSALSFTLSGNTLKAERVPGDRRPGGEIYSGTIKSNKLIKISGHGGFFDGNRPTWHYQFSGSIQDGVTTTISGSLEADLGGHRDCSITFLLPPAKLAAILAPSASAQPKAQPALTKPPTDVADGSDLSLKGNDGTKTQSSNRTPSTSAQLEAQTASTQPPASVANGSDLPKSNDQPKEQPSNLAPSASAQPKGQPALTKPPTDVADGSDLSLKGNDRTKTQSSNRTPSTSVQPEAQTASTQSPASVANGSDLPKSNDQPKEQPSNLAPSASVQPGTQTVSEKPATNVAPPEQKANEASEPLLAQRTNSSVDSYIQVHGGCQALKPSWENEFIKRPDSPYDKAFSDWTDSDFATVKSWFVRCLDHFYDPPDRRQLVLNDFDRRVDMYRNRQADAQAAAERERIRAADLAERQRKIESLSAQFQKSLKITKLAIAEFDDKANVFIQNAQHPDLNALDVLMVLGKKTAVLRGDAAAALAETKGLSSMLVKLGVPDPGLPIVDSNDRFLTSYKSIMLLQSRADDCIPRLISAGVPKSVTETRILGTAGDADLFLFQMLCPSETAALAFSQSNHLLTFNLGQITMWFKLRNDEGVGTEAQQNQNTRLVLVKLRSGNQEQSAESLWQSINLMEAAFALLAVNGQITLPQ